MYSLLFAPPPPNWQAFRRLLRLVSYNLALSSHSLSLYICVCVYILGIFKKQRFSFLGAENEVPGWRKTVAFNQGNTCDAFGLAKSVGEFKKTIIAYGVEE